MAGKYRSGRDKFEALHEEEQARIKAFIAENEHGPAFTLLRKAGLKVEEAGAVLDWLDGAGPE